MKRVLTLLSAVLLLSLEVAHAQNRRNDTKLPYSDPAYRLIDRLQKAGEVIGYPDGTYSGPPPRFTRHDFAAGIARDLDRRQSSRWAAENKEYHLSSPQILMALRLLTDEFAPELKNLGFSMPDVYARLAAPEPFPNVPMNHWAALSVEKLRKAGIVVGDPSGAF